MLILSCAMIAAMDIKDDKGSTDAGRSEGKKYVPPSRRGTTNESRAAPSGSSSSGPRQGSGRPLFPSAFSSMRGSDRSNSPRSSTHSSSSFGTSGSYRPRGASRFHVEPHGRNEAEEARIFKRTHQTTAGINFEKYADIPVEVSGKDVPSPVATFQECELVPIVKENIELCGYSSATPVQKHAFPIIMAGRDLMACAQTGSGKTAAFLVPLVSEILRTGPPKGGELEARPKARPFALIISPTRELTTQIYEEALKFSYRSWVRPVVVYGGADSREQQRQLAAGCDVLVATPGRLVDMIERGKVSLSWLRFLVLDEADRMLDMGFEPDIRRIIQGFDMPTKMQRLTLLFSATFPREIQNLARDFLRPDYIFLGVGKVGSSSENISQAVEYVQAHEKRSVLLDVLQAHDLTTARILVFVETKRDVDILEEFLFQQHFHAASIHGDRTQSEREAALLHFRQGRTPILLATAVASRGLDIPNVNQVVIYDFPSDIDEYVHRIGRTGRAGNLGSSIAFFTPDNHNMAGPLASILQEANQTIPSWLSSLTAYRSSPARSSGSRRPYARHAQAPTRDIRATGAPSSSSYSGSRYSSPSSYSSSSMHSWGPSAASPVPSSSSASSSILSRSASHEHSSASISNPHQPQQQQQQLLKPSSALKKSVGSKGPAGQEKVMSNWEDLDSSASLKDSWY